MMLEKEQESDVQVAWAHNHTWKVKLQALQKIKRTHGTKWKGDGTKWKAVSNIGICHRTLGYIRTPRYSDGHVKTFIAAPLNKVFTGCLVSLSLSLSYQCLWVVRIAFKLTWCSFTASCGQPHNNIMVTYYYYHFTTVNTVCLSVINV